jgi:hypothetical protein
LSLIVIFTVLSGCTIGIAGPGECQIEIPSTEIRNFFLDGKVLNKSTKEEFLKEWGTPDEITHTSETIEVWTYKRILWCGLALPLPLVLPVCNGFDIITFENDVAINLHTRTSVIRFIGGQSPACR